MADFCQLPDRRDLAAFPVVEKCCREFERAMDYVAQTAKLLDTDAEEMNREAAALAASTTMTQTDALYYIAERRRSDAIQKWGGGYG